MSVATLRILLLDDDAAHRMIAVRALRNELRVVEIREAASVDEVKKLLFTDSFLPNLALLDFNLGTQTGIDAVVMLRSLPNAASIALAILSTSMMDADVAASYGAGAHYFLQKSTDPAAYGRDLIAAVKFMRRSFSF